MTIEKAVYDCTHKLNFKYALALYSNEHFQQHSYILIVFKEYIIIFVFCLFTFFLLFSSIIESFMPTNCFTQTQALRVFDEHTTNMDRIGVKKVG